MKRLLLAFPFLLLAHQASADMATMSANMPRHDITNMTCDEIHAALDSDGSAIFHWTSSSGMPRWAKYMSPNRSCKMQQIKGMTTLKASDGSCRVATCSTYGKSPTRM
jgi:hypothetical protein